MLFAILILFCFLCGCNRNINLNESSDSASTEPSEETTTAKDSTIIISETVGLSELKHSEVDINISEYAVLKGFCVYGSQIYYAQDCTEYLLINELTDFEPQYKSQICLYDMEKEEYITIYEISDRAVEIDNVSFNGSYLVWTEKEITLGEFPNEYSADKLCIQDSNGIIKEIIADNIQYQGLPVKLTEKYIFWLMENDNGRNIYRYSLDSEEITEIISGINAEGLSYNALECNDGRITIFESGKDISQIIVYDYEGALLHSFEATGTVYGAICNSKMCIWVQDSQRGDNTFCAKVYDISKDVVYEINKDLYNVPAIQSDYLIDNVAYAQGVISWRLGDDKMKQVSLPNGKGAYLYSGANGSIYARMYIPNWYGMPWQENTVTIVRIFE